MGEPNFIESPYIAKLLAEAEAKGCIKGKIEGKIEGLVETLLMVIQKRSWELSAESNLSLRACRDGAEIRRWLDAAIDAASLDEFRRQAGV